MFLGDKDGTILYKTNMLECNYTFRGRMEQPIVDMVSVAFADMNHDGLTDIILIAGCKNDTFFRSRVRFPFTETGALTTN